MDIGPGITIGAGISYVESPALASVEYLVVAGGGGAGGSGIVIIRYPDSYAATTSTTGSPTITVAGGYRVYQFTGSGSITF